MNNILNQTLTEIVASNHRTVSVFEKYHLDFCCKGRRPLNQACLEKNISVEEVIKDLKGVMGGQPASVSAFPNTYSLTSCIYVFKASDTNTLLISKELTP